jgi:predicted methyltransferase
MNKRLILKKAIEIAHVRPAPDLGIEQYLMTPESMADQVQIIEQYFHDKNIFFLGDDDHMSALLSVTINIIPIVGEIDINIRKSLTELYSLLGISKFNLFDYDARNELDAKISADAFYINPPYSSKNQGKGAKVWIYRAAKTVPVGSTSVLIYPIDEDLPWTITCFVEIVTFAKECGLIVTCIDRDVHTYGYLPKDPGLLSSNIYLYKYADYNFDLMEDIKGDKLYR